MTPQQRASEALSLFQANRKSPEIEALLDAFFSFPTREEYDDQLRLVSEEMGKCMIFISDLPSHLSGAL